MTRDEYNAFCASLPATTHVVQWGGADVWKVGGKVFAIGNIEQVAVADGTVDARRATGSSSAEYLRQLSMSQRSNGVFINDPKGLFILRWYREVKGDGTPPDGPRYQNRACKYYKLTSDNDGEAFRWTSNYQIFSKVYLKKHSPLPLCYSLSAADKKMW